VDRDRFHGSPVVRHIHGDRCKTEAREAPKQGKRREKRLAEEADQLAVSVDLQATSYAIEG
jgi:hypothetical protein